MTVHIKNIKVRPRKNEAPNLCAQQLAAMLGCWAATNSMATTGTGPCVQAADALFNCMRTTPGPRKQHKPPINYHLARLGKKIQ